MKTSSFRCVPSWFKSFDFPDPPLRVQKYLSLRCEKVLSQRITIQNVDWSKCRPQMEVLIGRLLFCDVLIWFFAKRLVLDVFEDLFPRSFDLKVSANIAYNAHFCLK
jgi:hypothetical protein